MNPLRRLAFRTLLVPLTLLAPAVGCGGSDDKGVVPPGAADMAQAASGPDMAGGNAIRGEILVNQGRSTSTIQARFVTATQCDRRTVGPCTVLACPASFHDTEASAGAITVTGKNVPANVQLDPTPAGNYPSWYRPVALFLQGDVVTVAAAGATLPAFSQMLTAPSGVTIITPACDGTTCGSFDRAKDLTVSWNGGTDTVEAIAVVNTIAGATTSMSCRFPAADKQGTVPAAALSLLPRADGANALGRLAFASVASKAFPVGTLPTELLLEHIVSEGEFQNP